MSKENAKSIIDVLLEGTDYADVLTEQQKEKVTQLINETVDTRVKAKEDLLTEEFQNKEKLLKEEVENEKQRLQLETEENEKILVEQAEEYKTKLEETVLTKTKEYKESLEEKIGEKAAQYRTEIEKIVFNEAKDYKEKTDVALVEEVKKFKGDMIEKVSDYIEAKLEKLIPQEIYESATKLEVYEGLVQGIMESFSHNFIKLDDSSYELIKESKEEIQRLKNELQDQHKQNVILEKEKKEVEKKYKIESLTDGLTDNQKQKAKKLLEGYDVSELENRFKEVRDIIVESNHKETKKESEDNKTQTLKESKEEEKLEEKENKVVKTQQDEAVKQIKSTVIDNVKTNSKLEEKQDIKQKWASKVKPKYLNG